jgi:tetratricopeptide (TPR) repeat protein
LRDRYTALIDQIVEATLKGQIRSKEQVYQMLVQGIESGTGELFERIFLERFEASQALVKNAADELKKAKAERVLRALKTIQGEWERYQKEHQTTAAIASTTQAILLAESSQRFLVLLKAIDANDVNSLAPEQLKQLAKELEQTPTLAFNPGLSQEIYQFATGIKNGLASSQRLEEHLISWMYDQNRSLGFEGAAGQQGPWELWAKQVQNPFLKQLFQTLSSNQSIVDLVGGQRTNLSDWIELAITLQYVQRSLVTWFEKQPYDSKWGTKQAISTFLTFAVIWSQLSSGVDESNNLSEEMQQQLSQGCFQIMLQILRAFSQRPYFPLYGGVFALFSGNYLRETLIYLDEPLQRVEGTQEKARILTLLGYSLRTAGRNDRAIAFHQQALEIAQKAGDRVCEIANLNHLSRTFIARRNFSEAISSSQRALVLARQSGDRLGEANALTNLGYSEVLNARQQECMDPGQYETAVEYLKQGLKLSEQSITSHLDNFAARQSQALCYNSLGIAHVILGQIQMAMAYLEKGVEAAQFSGDLFLQGLNYSFLAEVSYAQSNRDRALLTACLGMYLLERIQAEEWRQPAGLLAILQGQLGDEGFRSAIAQHKSQIVSMIGVDGYDYLPKLLEDYRRSLN